MDVVAAGPELAEKRAVGRREVSTGCQRLPVRPRSRRGLQLDRSDAQVGLGLERVSRRCTQRGERGRIVRHEAVCRLDHRGQSGAGRIAAKRTQLIGADAVYDAAFRRAGLLRVYDLEAPRFPIMAPASTSHYECGRYNNQT